MYLYLVPFAYFFPEQGPAETRPITTHGYPPLPDDEIRRGEIHDIFRRTTATQLAVRSS